MAGRAEGHRVDRSGEIGHGHWQTSLTLGTVRPVSNPREPERAADLVLLGFVTGVLVLATPLRGLWASPESPWWLPFAVWLAVIVVAALSARAWMRHGD